MQMLFNAEFMLNFQGKSYDVKCLKRLRGLIETAESASAVALKLQKPYISNDYPKDLAQIRTLTEGSLIAKQKQGSKIL
jgi:hypothetical protein